MSTPTYRYQRHDGSEGHRIRKSCPGDHDDRCCPSDNEGSGGGQQQPSGQDPIRVTSIVGKGADHGWNDNRSQRDYGKEKSNACIGYPRVVKDQWKVGEPNGQGRVVQGVEPPDAGDRSINAGRPQAHAHLLLELRSGAVASVSDSTGPSALVSHASTPSPSEET
jgi:hypothetical protein